jgi:hypothetical protein
VLQIKNSDLKPYHISRLEQPAAILFTLTIFALVIPPVCMQYLPCIIETCYSIARALSVVFPGAWARVRGMRDLQGVSSPLAGQMFFRASLFSSFASAKRWLSTNADGTTKKLTNADYFKVLGVPPLYLSIHVYPYLYRTTTSFSLCTSRRLARVR